MSLIIQPTEKTVKYSDGGDYSNLEPNIEDVDCGRDVAECVWCGEDYNVTILEDKDICHSCGYIYS
jgi:hypothetical protein